MSTLTFLQVWGKMLYLPIWCKNFAKKIKVPKYVAGERKCKGEQPWDRITTGERFVPGLGVNDGSGRWGRHPCETYLTTEENVCGVPLCWVGGPVRCGSWIEGVTVSGELVCPAVLCPKCRVVGICPNSCLKVDHWPWWTCLLWWF